MTERKPRGKYKERYRPKGWLKLKEAIEIFPVSPSLLLKISREENWPRLKTINRLNLYPEDKVREKAAQLMSGEPAEEGKPNE